MAGAGKAEPSGIIWIGGTDDLALQAYQGTRAKANLKGLPVVRLLTRPLSVRHIVEGCPSDWHTIMVLYEGAEWTYPAGMVAAMIDLAIEAYADMRDVLLFAHPNEGLIAGYILFLKEFRLGHRREPRTGCFEPPLAVFRSESTNERVLH